MSDMQRVELAPISAAELAERVGNVRRAKRYASQARAVFDATGLSNVQGAICEESKRRELEREVARLLAGDGLVVSVDPEIIYEQPEYAALVQATVNGAVCASTLEDRTAWIHTALVQGRRIYDQREEARGYTDTCPALMAEMGLTR